jgi:hypothetical protein
MPGMALVEYFDYDADPQAGPVVSFTFSTFRGILPFVLIQEHRGLFQNADRAIKLLWELHRKNLSFWSWIAGFPGFFPLVSFLAYRSQLKSIRRQVAAGKPAPLPGSDKRSEKRVAIVYVSVLLLALAVIVGWAWLDPQGFSKLAARVRSRP